jgi:hypothetical protein
MHTGKICSQIDSYWKGFWSGGTSTPAQLAKTVGSCAGVIE